MGIISSQIYLGCKNTALVTDNGILICGNNNHGQLGLGDYKMQTEFKPMNLQDNIIKIVSCENSTMLLSKHTIYAQGSNNDNDLGMGYTNNCKYPMPVYTNSDSDAEFIDIIRGEGCTIISMKNSNCIKVAGNNYCGQLGSENIDAQLTFTDVIIDPSIHVKQVSYKEYSTIILLENGTIKSCGRNTNGQLGLGNTDDYNTFQTVPNISNVKQVSWGYNYAILLLNDGTLKSCGHNRCGQLGLGTNTNYNTFQSVPNISNVKQVVCGGLHTILLLNDGTIKSCGYNYYGQLGLGNDTNQYNTFQAVPNISNVKQVICRDDYTILLLNDGTIKACGYNHYGQLGLGNNNNYNAFKAVPNITNVNQVACGRDHTVLLLNDDTIKSCGDNSYGKLGLGNTNDYNTFQTPVLRNGESDYYEPEVNIIQQSDTYTNSILYIDSILLLNNIDNKIYYIDDKLNIRLAPIQTQTIDNFIENGCCLDTFNKVIEQGILNYADITILRFATTISECGKSQYGTAVNARQDQV